MIPRKWFLPSIVTAILLAVTLIFLHGHIRADRDGVHQDAQHATEKLRLNVLSGSKPPAPRMLKVAESEALELYFHEETAEIAVVDRNNGHVWWSNPPDRAEDPLATPYEKEVLASQLSLTYQDRFGNLRTFVSYTDGVANGQFTAESIEDGIRITYTLGEAETGIDRLPKYIHKDRLQQLVLDKLDPDEARYVQNRYYPLKNDPDVLERLDDAVSRPLVLERMIAAFEKAGYSEEDLAFDNEEHGVGEEGAAERPRFVVPIEYRLDGEDLIVHVPASKIEETENFRLRTLDILMFFGAAGAEEEGYTFVPDGMGSLIYHNNGKTKDDIYSQPLFGMNETREQYRRQQITEKARLPVLGLKKGDRAWFAMIEEGAGLASVRADISGKRHSYNHAYIRLHLREEDEVSFAVANRVEDVPVMNEKMYGGSFTVRYTFLYGEEADYSGMAAEYRERLYASGQLTRIDEKGDLPFYLDVIGAITRRKFFLGVPYEGTVATTTFEQAQHIYEQLSREGVHNVHMRYLGWFNKGIYHTKPTNIRLVRALGNRFDLDALIAAIAQGGGQLYPDTAFQHVNRDSPGFFPSQEASRYLTKYVAWRAHYNRARNRMQWMKGDYYLLSPAHLPKHTSKFADRYERFGLSSLSLRDLGDLLHSDARTKQEILREEAREIVVGELAMLAQRFPDLLVAGGNAYALPYARHLIDVPESTSRFNITDEEVPFYQMVVHGSIDYAGAPLNLANEQDLKRSMLKLVEYGMAPRFAWSYAPSSMFKQTMFDHYYSTYYEDWLEQAVDLYLQLNEALSSVRSEHMVGHEKIDEGVFKTTYESGSFFIVNYNEFPVTVDDAVIPAQSFVAGGKSQ